MVRVWDSRLVPLLSGSSGLTGGPPVRERRLTVCLSASESQDSGFLYFCFRWLLIRFKRELSFQDVLRLWEVSFFFWSGSVLDTRNRSLSTCLPR